METFNLLKSKIRKEYLAVIILAIISRLIPHIPNFTPIFGIAVFSGAKFKGKAIFIIPILSMFLSDIVIGFHNTMLFVYTGVIVSTLIGYLINKRQNFKTITSALLFSSLVFYLITNFGVWLEGTMYEKTLNGLMESYVMGIPFFRNSVLSDLMYGLSLFYGYRLATSFTFNRIKNFKISSWSKPLS